MKDAFSKHPQVKQPRFVQKIQEAISQLSKQEARVAQYMVLNANSLGFETGASIAKKAGTSEVTVGRLLRRLGYKGMARVKEEIKIEHAARDLDVDTEPGPAEIDPAMKLVLDTEIQALMSVFKQASGPRWGGIVQTLCHADTVFVSGFQSIRGVAEDFSRRLSLARDNVRFMSAHDSMLGEWIGNADDIATECKECLVIIDVVPYAREAEVLSKLCREQGRDLVVVSDEFCHWANDYTDMVIHAPSKSRLFLESTGAIIAALNLMVHAVAESNPEATSERLERWQSMTR
ncbi:MAG: MurR/RpiR family transcriptional regulator, partial [Rhodospirillales bacterium]|nr:MurR/RpiR family transcriptional regulator [Rhodospirillales bacterium]